MADRKFTFELDFQAKNLDSIKNQLKQVKNMINDKEGLKLGFSSAEIAKTKAQIDELTKSLETSFNKSTGKINYSDIYQKFLDGNNPNKLYELESRLNSFGVNGKNVFDQLYKSQYNFGQVTKKTEGFVSKLNFTLNNTARWRLSNAVLNAFSGQLQKAYFFAKDLNESLTNIRIVSGKTNDYMATFAENANKAAKALKIGTLEYTEAALVYFQQGLNPEDVEKMTKATLIGANITGESSEEISNLLTATINGYKKSADEAMRVTDILAAVGATTAADFYELATAMSKVSSMAGVAGVPMENLASQIATVVSVTKEAPESVGNAFKTIYARMLAFRNESKGMMVDEDGESFGVPAVEKALARYNSLAGTQISLFEVQADGTKKLRETNEVIEEIGNSWDSVTSKEAKFGLVTALAGTRQQNRLVSLFEAWDEYKDTVQTAINSEGTALEQQAVYMDSYKGSLKSFQVTLENLYMELLNPDALKEFVDLLEKTVKLFTGLVDIIGGLPTMSGGLFGFATKSLATKPLLAFNKIRLGGNYTGINDEETKLLSANEDKIAQLRSIHSEEYMANLDKEQEKMIALNRQYATYKTALDQINAAHTALQSFEKIEGTVEGTQKNLDFKDKFHAGEDFYIIKQALKDVLPKNEELANSIEETQQKFIKLGKKSKITAKDIEEFNDLISKLRLNLDNLSKDTLEQVGFEHISALQKATDTSKTTATEGNKNWKEYIDKEFQVADATIKMQQAVSTGVMMFTALNGIWRNDSIPLSEKLTDTLGSMTSALFMNFDVISNQTMIAYKHLIEEQQKIDEANKVNIANLTKQDIMFRKLKAGVLAFGTAMKSAIPQLLAVTAITAVISLAGEAINKVFTTLQEQAEKVDDVRASINGLKSEIEELENIDTSKRTESENARLEILKRQLEIQTLLLEKELERLAAQELFGKGDLNPFTTGISGEIESINQKLNPTNNPRSYLNMNNVSYRLNKDSTNEQIQAETDKLLKYEDTINKAKLKLEEYKNSMGENSEEYQKLKKNIDLAENSIENQYKAISNITGLTIEEVKAFNKVSEAIKKATEETKKYNNVIDTLSDLQLVETNLNNISKAVNEFRENGIVSIGTLQSLQEAFGSNTEEFSKFVEVLGNANSTQEEVNKVTNILVQAYLNTSASLTEVDKASKDLLESQLKLIGIENAAEVALTAYNESQYKAEIAALNFTSATKDQIKNLINLAKTAGATGETLIMLARVQELNNTLNSGIHFTDKEREDLIERINFWQEQLSTMKAFEDIDIKYEAPLSKKSSSPSPIGAEDKGSKYIAAAMAIVKQDEAAKQLLETEQKRAEITESITDDLEVQVKILNLQNKQIADLKTANEKLHKYANEVRQEFAQGQFKIVNTDEWFDSLGEASSTYLNLLDSFTGKTDEYSKQRKAAIETEFDMLYKLKHQYMQNLNDITELEFSILQIQEEQTEKKKEQYKNQKEDLQEILDMTEEMVRQEWESKIEVWDEKLDNFEKYIDLKKQELQLDEDIYEYERALHNQQKSIRDIQEELLTLKFDDSAEANARRLTLEDQLYNEELSLEDLKHERSLTLQEQAWDDQLQSYTDLVEEEKKILQDFLDDSQAVMDEVFDRLNGDWSTLYDDLNEWNLQYGTGIQNDIIKMWQDAQKAFESYRSTVGGFQQVYQAVSEGAETGVGPSSGSSGGNVTPTGNYVLVQSNGKAPSTAKIGDYIVTAGGIVMKMSNDGSVPAKFVRSLSKKVNSYAELVELFNTGSYHDGGIVGKNFKLKSTEEFAKLLKGEYIATEQQMQNFITRTLPNLITTSNIINETENNNMPDINMIFNVAGSLDENVIPDIKEIAKEAIEQINISMKNKGMTRTAKKFSY